MPVLSTTLDSRSADFAANAATMRAVVDDLRVHLERIAQGGGEAARSKHLARGKLLPLERVHMLLDPGTPFLEVAPLAAMNLYNNDAPSAGLIAGIGRVSGVDCMVACNDATVKGGSSTLNVLHDGMFAELLFAPGDQVKDCDALLKLQAD
jgi:3-methylcrotonyl-CoA carboxylase beta subunit